MSRFNIKMHNTPTLAFFWRFISYVILFQTAVYVIHSNPNLSQFIQFQITNVVAFFYQLLVEPIVVENNTLRHIDSSSFLIVDNECTGLILLASVCSVFMAFKHPLLTKVKMISVAIFILQSENILRIMHLLFIINKENDDFDIYHLYIWQVINFITALFVIYIVERIFKDKEL